MDFIKNQERLLLQIKEENDANISTQEYVQYMVNGKESDDLIREKILNMESLLARYNKVLDKCIVPKSGGDNVDTNYTKLVKIKPPLKLLTNKILEKLTISDKQKNRLIYRMFYKDGNLHEDAQIGGDEVIVTNLTTVDSVLFSVRDLSYICKQLQNYWIIELTPNNDVVIARLLKLTAPINEFETAYKLWVKENVTEMYKLPIEGCAEFYRKYGFEVYTSTKKSFIPLLWTQQNTAISLSEIFHKYALYSEYDFLNMDWTEYDNKVYPLIEKSTCEIGGTLRVEDRKIKITHIQEPEMPGATRVISYDVMKFHIHPNTRYGGLHPEVPSSTDVINTIYGFINKSIVASIVGAKEGAYIITLPEHIAKYGIAAYDAAISSRNFASDIFDRSPVTFIKSINDFKRACMNYGIIIYFRPTPGFDINKTIVNTDATYLKYKVNYFDEQNKILDRYKTPAEIAALNYGAFDRVKYIFDKEVLFWVSFDEKNNPNIAPEQEVVFTQPFAELSHDIHWPKNNPNIKFALIYFPRDAMLSISDESIKFVFTEYSIKWFVLLSPSIIVVAQRDAPIYGPINRSTMKPF